MDKEQKHVTGYVLLPILTGEGVTIVNNDKLTFTSRVMAVHEMSSSRAVIETMNTVYIVESRNSDVCVSFSPVKKRRKWLSFIFG